MKIHLAQIAASTLTLGVLFMATPAFASYNNYSNYGYNNYNNGYYGDYDYQRQSACNGPYDPNCIAKEWGMYYPSYNGYGNYNDYDNQRTVYKTVYNTWYPPYTNYGNYGYNNGYQQPNCGYMQPQYNQYQYQSQGYPYGGYQYQYQYQYQYGC